MQTAPTDNKKSGSFDDLVKPADIAGVLGYDLSNPTQRAGFWRNVKRWRLPRFYIGPKTILFSRSGFEAWLENRRVGERSVA